MDETNATTTTAASTYRQEPAAAAGDRGLNHGQPHQKGRLRLQGGPVSAG